MPLTGAAVARRVRLSPAPPLSAKVAPARLERPLPELGPDMSVPSALDNADAAQVVAALGGLGRLITPLTMSKTKKAVGAVLERLSAAPGDTWQERWATLFEPLGASWSDQPVKWRHEQLIKGLDALICLRVIRPAYPWLVRVKFNALYLRWGQLHDPDVFADAEQRLAARRGGLMPDSKVRVALARIMIHTGKGARDLLGEDLERYLAAVITAGQRRQETDVLWELLREMGILDEPNRLDDRRRRPQLSPEGLVDRYQLACQPIRDIFVRYVASRATEVDYRSLDQLSCKLANNFWRDLELHEPGIASLDVDPMVASRWKERVRVTTAGKARMNATSVLMAVRAFYLDIAQWAIAEPQTWAEWAFRSPVSTADTRSYHKERRHQRARMQARTRTLSPVLPALVETAERRLKRAEAMLTEVRRADIGASFTLDGKAHRRAGFGSTTERRSREGDERFRVVRDEDGSTIDPIREEFGAFWAWALIEVLRHSGVRCEELLEITHLSIRRYHTPDGETMPLLQVSPSKTDMERVIPISPELSRVLARIISRLRAEAATVPLAVRYDYHEREASPPLPFLFQRPTVSRPRVFTPKMVYSLPDRTVEIAGLKDVDGAPMQFRPHDFRRIFATEAVGSGLPIHIAAKLLGHLDLNTTRGYLAVYPEDVIRHFSTFITERRSMRPGAEYREPSAEEWTEFEQHFTLRKVALGRCCRPYGTPCAHFPGRFRRVAR